MVIHGSMPTQHLHSNNCTGARIPVRAHRSVHPNVFLFHIERSSIWRKKRSRTRARWVKPAKTAGSQTAPNRHALYAGKMTIAKSLYFLQMGEGTVPSVCSRSAGAVPRALITRNDFSSCRNPLLFQWNNGQYLLVLILVETDKSRLGLLASYER